MSHRLPEHIDPWRIAESAENLAGVIGTARMTRLAPQILNPGCDVSVNVDGGRSGGWLVLDGRAWGVIEMTCQRCLEPVAIALDAAFRLGLVESEDSAAGLPTDLEPLVLRQHEVCSLARLIEDELILALPIVPRHEGAAACKGENFTTDERTDVRRPFSDLGTLWARAKEQE